MAKMRTLPKALEELQKNDPETGVSLFMLRKWAKTGQLPTVQAGYYTLVDIDTLYAFLEGKLPPAEPEEV